MTKTATKAVTTPAKTAFKIMEKAADVTKAIESIANRAKKLDRDIHVAAVSCLFHADKHGDVTLMQKLITSLGRSQRRNAVIAWAIAFGKFEASEDGKSVVYAKASATDLEGAMGTDPWDFKPEAPFQAFDLGAELVRLLKRAETAANDDRNKVDPEVIRKVRQVAGIQAA